MTSTTTTTKRLQLFSLFYIVVIAAFCLTRTSHAWYQYERTLTSHDQLFVSQLLNVTLNADATELLNNNVTNGMDLGPYMKNCRMYQEPYKNLVYTMDEHKYEAMSIPIMGCDHVYYPEKVSFYGDILVDKNVKMIDLCTEMAPMNCNDRCNVNVNSPFNARESIYCQFCHKRQSEKNYNESAVVNDDNFLTFHIRMANGNCTRGISYAYLEGCSGISNGVTMVVSNGNDQQLISPSRVCYCHKWGRYSRNDCSRLYVQSLRRLNHATKYMILILCVLLLTFSTLLIVVPLVVKLATEFRKKAQTGSKLQALKVFFDLKFLSVMYMTLGLVLLLVENVVTTSHTGFNFVPLRPIVQFLQLFCVCHIMVLWVHMLNVANTSKQEWSKLLLVSLGIMYVVLILLLVVLYVLTITSVKANVNFDSRVANIVIVYVAFLLIVLFTSGLLVYGMKMFLLLKKMQNVKLLDLKFTRYMFMVLICAVINIIVAVIEVGFDYARREKLGSSIVFYDIKLFLLDLSLLLSLYTTVYLIFDLEAIKKVYMFWRKKD